MNPASSPPAVPAHLAVAAHFARQALTAAIHDLLRLAGETLGASRAYACAFEASATELGPTGVAIWCAPGLADGEPEVEVLSVSRCRRWQESLHRGEPAFATELTPSFEERELLRAGGVRSLALIPVRTPEGSWGYVGFEDCASLREWASERDTLCELADLVGALVTRHRVEAGTRERAERFQHLAEAAVEGILLHDDGRILHANKPLAAMLGVPTEALIGRSVFSFTPPDHHTLMRERLRLGTSEPYEIEILRVDGTRVPVEVFPRVLHHEGRTVRVAAVRDISERRRADEARMEIVREQEARRMAEETGRRAAFLADASRVLGSSFEYEDTLASFARLAVPTVADFCAIDLIEDDEVARRVAVAHVDPEKEAFFREMCRVEIGRVRADDPGFAVLRAGTSVFLPRIDPQLLSEALASSIEDPEARRVFLSRLDAASLILVPLRIGLRTVGIATLVRSGDRDPFTPDDLTLAEELAHRASLAIDNARLFLHAQQATRDRDSMLAVVAHDLRNPLSAITLAADVVEAMIGAAATEGQTRQLKTIRASAARMNRLIQDLLESVRIQEGRFTIHPEVTDLGSLLAEAYESQHPLALQKEIDLRLVCMERLPKVRIDGPRMHQVLTNLVGNAIKFTPAGGRVTLSVEGDDTEIRCRISDTGPGIPAQELGHLFGRFWQADRHDQRGVGLGLSIVQGIVEAHGGRIWIESEVGQGTQVHFTLPVAKTARSGAT